MDFRGDERGQPVVIGALLVFTILILAFSSYQAFVVPNQNADVEFKHSQQVENDMVDLRVGIVRAAVSGGDASTSIQLGTQYPSRTFALNPSPPAGSLRTTDPGEIIVNGSNDEFIGVCHNPGTTRSIVYRPGYNEFQGGSTIVYENTFAYSQHRNGVTRELIKTNQRLVDEDDGVIELIAVEGNYAESGTHRVGVDLVRGETRIKDVNQPEITLPTHVENRTTWEEILEGDYTIEEFQPGEFIKFSLNGRYEVRCTPVGVNKAPNSGSANVLRQTSTDGNGGTTTGITATSISNLESSSSQQSQTFQFDINGVLPHNEKVIMNLTSANQNGVNYSYSGKDPSSVTDGNGKVSLEKDGNFLNFTANQGGHEGPVTIEVNEIDVDSTAGENFDIVFTRDDTGDSDTESFEITSSN